MAHLHRRNIAEESSPPLADLPTYNYTYRRLEFTHFSFASMSTNPYSSLTEPIYTWLYFSTIMATMFYGFACMQIFFYYVHYENDLLRWKIFVTTIWALNTIHTALTVAGTYKYVTGGLANPSSSLDWPPELTLQVVPTILAAVLTQGFLMHRIYVFSGKKIITLLLWSALSILELVSSTIYVANLLYTGADGSLHNVGIIEFADPIFRTTLVLIFSAAAGQDILIAILLVFLLFRERRALFKCSAHIVQRLTVFAVNTGTWTATFALLALFFLYVWPSEKLYVLFGYPICSIYCNTVLANLNARSYLRGEFDVQHNNNGLPTSATPSSNRPVKLVFAQPEAVQRTAESVTSSNGNV